ncbi:MAG: F390 synthetase-related protein [Deinococcota bacterium]
MLPQLEVAKAFVAARLRQFSSREQLVRYQQHRLYHHLAWLKAHIPFYAEINPNELASVPLLERASFMTHFERLNIQGIKRDYALETARRAERDPSATPIISGLSVGLSSGTSSRGQSGERGIFLASERERYQWAGNILAKVLPQVWRQRQRIALFLRANSNLYSSVRSRRVQFAYFDLATPVQAQIAYLNNLKPTVIVAPPSRLRALAEQIARLEFRPRQLFAGAEVLELIDQAAIENAFGLPVGQIYQATEGFLGVTCTRGTLHLNEDVMLVQKEPLERGRFIPIITDFWRKTQPIVRYRLNDLLRETTCDCGSVMQAVRVEGREGDVFDWPRQQAVPKRIYPDEIRSFFDLAGLEQFAIQQNSPHHFLIQLAPYRPESIHALQGRLAAFAADRQLTMPGLEFAPYQFESGIQKLRRVRRKTFPETIGST